MQLRATIGLCALLAAPLSAQQAADDAAVRAVVRSYVNARELRDPAAIGALWRLTSPSSTVPMSSPAPPAHRRDRCERRSC
jgi:hypothetical protein